MADIEGLLLDESLAVCRATESDARVDGLATDRVAAAGDETELAAAGEIVDATLVETPVPTGTICRYCRRFSILVAVVVDNARRTATGTTVLEKIRSILFLTRK